MRSCFFSLSGLDVLLVWSEMRRNVDLQGRGRKGFDALVINMEAT